MHLFDQRILGAAILFLMAMLVSVKGAATRSVLDKPGGGLMVRIVNIYNLFFLLAVNPLVAILLITRRVATIDPTHFVIGQRGILAAVETVGGLVYVSGFSLMAGALVTLGRNYQLGGSAPRAEDKLVTAGPYRWVRHPMYAAALGISLGLALLIQSLALLCVFSLYLVLVLLLVPAEEEGLRTAYGEQFTIYGQRTRKLVPYIY